MRRLIAHHSVLILVTSVITASCKQIMNDSSSKDLKPGILLNDRSLDPKKSQALIYYANNPVQTGAYVDERQKILASFEGATKINSLKSKQISAAQQKFGADYDEFSKAVNSDTASIKASFCRPDAPSHAAVIFITNAGIIGQNLQYCAPGEGIKSVPSQLAQNFYDVYSRIKVNPIYEHSPLSHVDMFKTALTVASTLFPSSGYEYSMVIKSHGNEQMTITPKVAYESKLVTPTLIAGYFASRPDNRAITNARSLEKDGLDKDGLEKDGLDKGGLDKGGLDKGGLDKGGLDKGGLDKGGLEGEADKVIQGIRAAGIAKSEMMGMILDKSHGMYFNVLFLESCKSDLGTLLMDLAEYEIAPNIGYLFASDEKGLSYNTVSWTEAGEPGATSLRTWLSNHLNRIAGKTR
jgi:hypothetical protein